MKTLRLLFLLVLMPLLARGASPSFNSFDTNWFTIQSFIISGNTNKIVSWPAVNTTYLDTNGYVLNVNTGALAAAIGGGGGGSSLPFNPNQFSTNGGQVSITNTVRTTNATTWSSHTVNVTGNTASPQFVITNSSGLYHGFFLDGSTIAYTSFHPTSTSGAFSTVSGGLRSVIALWTRSNNTPNLRFMRIVNENDRTSFELLSDAFSLISTPVSISNATPTGTLITGSDGVVRLGTGLGFGATRQFTAATNAVRVFAGTGTTVTITNNTGNGSLDYRVDSSGGGIDTNGPVAFATNVFVGGTLTVNNFNAGTLTTTNLVILNDPRIGSITGLPVTWTATNELVVGSGSAWIESETNMVRFAGETVPVSGLPTNSWAYVYLQHTNGVSGIIVVTNAPNAPFFGTARSQLGATTRRFLCPIRTDSGGGVRVFQYEESSGVFTWTKDYTETLVLNAGTATSSTLVNASNAVPPISFLFIGNTLNSATAGNVAYGSGEFTVANTAGSRTAAINATRFYTSAFVVNTNQQFAYLYSTGPTGGSFFVTVLQFFFSR